MRCRTGRAQHLRPEAGGLWERVWGGSGANGSNQLVRKQGVSEAGVSQGPVLLQRLMLGGRGAQPGKSSDGGGAAGAWAGGGRMLVNQQQAVQVTELSL